MITALISKPSHSICNITAAVTFRRVLHSRIANNARIRSLRVPLRSGHASWHSRDVHDQALGLRGKRARTNSHAQTQPGPGTGSGTARCLLVRGTSRACLSLPRILTRR